MFPSSVRASTQLARPRDAKLAVLLALIDFAGLECYLQFRSGSPEVRPVMHEASIVASLLRHVAEKTPPHVEVHRVHVRVGRLTNVSPDALNFYFGALRHLPLTSQSELVVNQPLLSARCQYCGQAQEFDEWTWKCPLCNSGPLIFLNGSELTLEAIEVDDDGNYSHR